MVKYQKQDKYNGEIVMKRYATLSNMVYVIKHSVKEQKVFAPLLILYTICTALSEYIPIIVYALIISKLEAGFSIKELAIAILTMFVIAVVVYGIGTYTKSQLEWRYFFARTKFIDKVLRKLMNMDYELLEQPHVLDAQQKALRTTSGSNYGIQGMLESSVQNIVNILKIVIALSLVMTQNPWIVTIVIVLTLIHFIVVDQTKKRDKKKTWDSVASKWRKINYLDKMTSDFAYGKEIRLFQIQDWLSSKQKEENDATHRLICRSQNRWMLAKSMNQIIAIIQGIILYSWLIYNVLEKNMSIAGFVLYLQVIYSFSNTLSMVLEEVSEIRRKSEEVDDYRGFIEFQKKEEGKQKEGKRKIQSENFTAYEFAFENVSFRYSGQETYALKNLNLTIKSGQRLAVVGLNGAGKTTFIKLLMRLYEPTEGRILINGVDIREYDKQEYFALFAPVFQNIELYAFTLLENISMKSNSKTENERVKECLIRAGLKEKLEQLPKGMDTQLLKVLYDDGVDLSGGEKQKLALARALYKNAPVVVLDEPAAALDALAEHQLYREFDQLIDNKTAVYISHRLASTRFCDSIAVFKDGRLIELSEHDTLMNKNGVYSELFRVQAKYYQEDEAVVNG